MRILSLNKLSLLRFAVGLFCSLFIGRAAFADTDMQSYVEAMQPGWNLGNSLDAIPGETSWGNPSVTQELIQQIADQGFKSIRIPVTWGDHTGPAPSYSIEPAWLNRVEEIVDWSLEADLHVLINVHHDSWQWVSAMPANPEATLARYAALWSQIANRFKDHSDKLMFESINEPFFDGADRATQLLLLEELNTVFFDLVRGTGGGNATRPLVLPSLGTNHSQDRLDSLYGTIVELDDPNIIATIHYYGFWPFSVNIAGYTRFDSASINDLETAIDAVYDTFVANGIPVVIGEYGLLAFDGNAAAVERGEMLKFFEYFTHYSNSKGIAHQWWDNGQHFNRYTHQWRDSDIYSIVAQSVAGRSSTADTDLIFVKSDAPEGDARIQLDLNGNDFVSLEDGATLLVQGIDYTLDGSELTVHASFLAERATGAFGEKSILTVNFSSGPAWKLHVRHQAVPQLAAANGTKAGGVVIPTAFNGDLLATMEATYPGGGNAGPHDWTSFKQYNDAFRPNYADNTISITKEFLAATTGDTIDLKFHFWSGQIANYRLTLQAGDTGGDAEYRVISEEGLASGWNSWSWASVDTASDAAAHSGATSISVDAGAWGALYLAYTGAQMDTSPYHTLTFWANGGPVGGQRIAIGATVNYNGTGWTFTTEPLPANTWTKIEVPLDSLAVEGNPDINGFTFMNASGSAAPTFYVDDVHLTTAYASTIEIVVGAPAPVITSPSSATGIFGSPFSYQIAALHDPTEYSATGLPPGLELDAVAGVIAGTPTSAGDFLVSLEASNLAGLGEATLRVIIEPAPVSFTLGGAGSSPFSAAIHAAYDGAPIGAEIETTPADIPVTVTYNGDSTPPTLPGTYQVVVTSDDSNYVGSAEGILVISSTALVRHAPQINGDLDGSLQLLSGEWFAINGSGTVSSDLLVPGSPSVRLNGNPVYAGVLDATGSPEPSDYGIALNGGSVVRFIMRRVDPIAMPEVSEPSAPTGTRSVTLNKATQSPGDFATLRDLTLNGNAGSVAIPAGAYGHITVNGKSSIVLGSAGAAEPTVYDLQGLRLNGKASVQIVGPVILRLADGTSLNGRVGSVDHPDWLDLRIFNGGLSLNGNAELHGTVTAPNGSISINGELYGRVVADRLTINGNGLLSDPAE